jgi:amphi-Trp domain-containing protein
VSGSVRLDADTDAVAEFERVERLSGRRAAEHLVDIAYALTGGERLEVRHDGMRVTVPVADEVLLIRRTTSHGDRVEVAIELSWTSPEHVDPAGRS